MSRREDRYSDPRHHRSKFDREPSPKRSRRDGKPATERQVANNQNPDTAEVAQDQKHRHRLQDPWPLEAPPPPSSPAADSKVETRPLRKEADKKTNEQHEGAKHSLGAPEAPRSRSFFQHDERSNTRQVGRSLRHGEITDRGWRDSRDRQSERASNRTLSSDSKRTGEKSRPEDNNNRVWHHDAYFKMEADSKPPTRKRPSFREKKVVVDDKETKAPVKSIQSDLPEKEKPFSERTEKEKASSDDRPERERTFLGRSDKEMRVSDRLDKETTFSDRPERPSAGVRDGRQGQGCNFGKRESYGGGGSFYVEGRERFNGRQGGFRPDGGRVEKWKHDLFDETNRSPTSKNEEDLIAKVEALLASS